MIRLFICTVLSFSFSLVCAQVPLNQLGFMNNTIQEPSGMDLLFNRNNGHFDYWVHNDYQNPDDIYSIHLDDPLDIIRTIDVGSGYIDWEDMTSDDAGNIYLADFGNWVGPNDLQVVKIPNPDTYGGAPPVVEIIEYIYPFAGIKDCEAIVHLDGSLYIFSKRISTADNPSLVEGFTYCFKIPDVPEPNGANYTAQLVGSFNTMMVGDVDAGTYRVSGADLSPDKSKLILITYERFWVFSCFDNDDFFNGTANNLETNYRQYEGVSFVNNHEVVITKEGNPLDPLNNPKLFHLDLFPWIDGSCIDCNKCSNGDFSLSNHAWSKFEFGAGSAILDMSNGYAEIDIQTLGTSGWHINLRHKSIILEDGKTYTIRYKAWAQNNRNISVIANNQSGSMGYAYFNQAITTTPTIYEHTFTMNNPDDFNSYFSFNVGTQFAHKVFFDDIELEETDCACPQNRYFMADISNQTEHYEVQNTIFAENLIDGTDIIYDGGNCVELNPGFEVSLGTIFHAYIDGCGGN